MNANFYCFLALSLHFLCTFGRAQKRQSGDKMLKNVKKTKKNGTKSANLVPYVAEDGGFEPSCP